MSKRPGKGSAGAVVPPGLTLVCTLVSGANRHPCLGSPRGTDAVLGFFGRTQELTAGTFQVELHEVVADDQHTVGLHLATGEREGRTLEDHEVVVFHVRDDKVVEAWQYLENQYAYDEFFS